MLFCNTIIYFVYIIFCRYVFYCISKLVGVNHGKVYFVISVFVEVIYIGVGRGGARGGQAPAII